MGLSVEIEKKLNNMTLQVAFHTGSSKEISGILGPSGSGKSMTLKCIAGIETPDRGRIVLNGRVLFDQAEKIYIKTQNRGVGYLFQSYALFPKMTVRENIEIAAANGREQKRKTADCYLERFQLEALAGDYPAHLSGGQQQRVALARILASNPEVLLLDEPFSALDTHLKEQLQMELLDLLREYEGEVLLVTHSRDEAYRLCSQIHIFDHGQIVTGGNTREVFTNPKAVTAARLTGCKNIAFIQRISPNRIQIPHWNMELILTGEIPKEADCIGIRAHYLKPVSGLPGKNCMACRWEQILEDPFEITAVTDRGVWWKVSKEEWETVYGKQMPDYLEIPEDRLLFLQANAR